MTLRLTRPAAALLALGLAGSSRAGTASAQARLELTPFVATYFPLSRLVDSASFSEKQSTVAAFGARLRYAFSTTLSLEVSGIYSASKLITDAGGQLSGGASVTNIQSGRVLLSSLRLRFQPRRSNFFALAGPALIWRRGDAWPKAAYRKRDAFGGVVGIGARSEVSSRLDLNVVAELYLYSLDADGGGATGRYYNSTFQKDLVVTVGVPLGLINR